MPIDLDLDALIAPLNDNEPCGANLEYDADFMALEEALRVDAGQEFGGENGGESTSIEGAGIDWALVRKLAEGLLERTRDLRVAVSMTRALLHTEGFAGVPLGLRLIAGLLERHWDHVHPQLDAEDDNDPTMRINALSPLVSNEAALNDLRSSWLVRSRQAGTLTVHALELAQGRVPALEGETPLAEAQISAMLDEAVQQNPALPSAADDAVSALKDIVATLLAHVDASQTVDFKPLELILNACRSALARVVPAEAVGAQAMGSAAVEAESSGHGPVSRMGEIRSRKDVLSTLDVLVQYLQRTEPTNPAQMLLRRAQRVMNMSFLEAINELAPDALRQAESMVGEQLNSPES